MQESNGRKLIVTNLTELSICEHYHFRYSKFLTDLSRYLEDFDANQGSSDELFVPQEPVLPQKRPHPVMEAEKGDSGEVELVG